MVYLHMREDTIQNDLIELNQRFDTSPRDLTKGDFGHLTHTVGHIASATLSAVEDAKTAAAETSTEVSKEVANTVATEVSKQTATETATEIVQTAVKEVDKKQWRKDTQNAVTNKRRLKYTTDGFAIADKSLSLSTLFYVNERIAYTGNFTNFHRYYINAVDSVNDIATQITLEDVLTNQGTDLTSGDIFIIKWNPELPDDFQYELLGNSSKIFTYYRSRRYVKGKRLDSVKRVLIDWSGKEFSSWDSFANFLLDKKVLIEHDTIKFGAGTRLTVFQPSDRTTRNLFANKQLGAKKDKHARLKWVVVRTKVIGNEPLSDNTVGYMGFPMPSLYKWTNIIEILHRIARHIKGKTVTDNRDRKVIHCYIDVDNAKYGWVDRYYFDVIVYTKDDGATHNLMNIRLL